MSNYYYINSKKSNAIYTILANCSHILFSHTKTIIEIYIHNIQLYIIYNMGIRHVVRYTKHNYVIAIEVIRENHIYSRFIDFNNFTI